MIYVYAIAFVAVVAIGAGLAYWVPTFSTQKLSLWMGFVAAYIFSTTLLHLLPEVLATDTLGSYLGLGVLGGFLVQHFLAQFTLGVEHGHAHDLNMRVSTAKVFIALLLHAFLEGLMGLHGSERHGMLELNSLLFGVFLHKGPAAFALASMLRSQKRPPRKIVLMLGSFALATPLALFLSYFLMEPFANTWLSLLILSFLGGMFLHLSTAMFFEVAPKHVYGWKKNGALLLGVSTGILMEYGPRLLSLA